MAFLMKSEGGLHIPIVTCDACGVVIKDAGMAGVVYPWSAAGETVPIRVLCKVNHCLAADRSEAWQELSHWLMYTLQNTGIRTLKDYRREKEQADMLSLG